MTNTSNVSENEVEKFDSIASRWWDAESEFKPLHELNPVRANWIDCIGNVAGKNLLDVGCGGGLLTEAMAVRGAVVTGIDMSPMAIEVANLHKLESGLQIDYVKTNAEEFAQGNANKFDIITCMELLEHIPEPELLVQSIAKMLKPGGYAFFSTINRHVMGYLKTIVAAEYILKWLPKGTHEYKSFIKPFELSTWCEKSGLKVESMEGLVYNPIFKEYKLAKGKVESNYMLSCRKIESKGV